MSSARSTKSLGERGLESKAVETRLCRATLSLWWSQASLQACDGALSKKAALLGTMNSSIIFTSPQPPQHRCAPLQAPPLVRRREVLIHHWREDRKKKNGREKRFQHVSPASLANAPPSCTPGRCCDRAQCHMPADVWEHWRLNSTARWQTKR